MFSKKAASAAASAASRIITPETGSTSRSICAISKLFSNSVYKPQCEDGDQIDEKQEKRKRQEAESVLFQQSRILSSISTESYSLQNVTDKKAISEDYIPDSTARMTHVLQNLARESFVCSKLMGKCQIIKWEDLFSSLNSHSSSVLNKSSGIVSMSTVGCVLFSASKFLSKSSLPNVMEMAGNTINSGKPVVESASLERERNSFSILKELYQNEMSQSNKTGEAIVSMMELACQTFQNIEDKRSQEVSSIVTGRS